MNSAPLAGRVSYALACLICLTLVSYCFGEFCLLPDEDPQGNTVPGSSSYLPPEPGNSGSYASDPFLPPRRLYLGDMLYHLRCYPAIWLWRFESKSLPGVDHV